jgi:ribosome biogenesis GTPase A
MVSTNSPYYREYLAKKQQLESLIEKQLDVLSNLEMTAWQRDVERLRARVQQDNFKVFVMGEFKRGKSTFINALLGEKVLPAYAIPCTAIINEVKWGNQPRAVLHQLRAPDGSVAQPQDIPVTDIDQYVVIKESKPGYFGGTEVVYTNPYEKV